MSHPDVLFVSYQDTLKLLSSESAMKICEDVYRMHARGSVVFSKPPSFKIDIAEGFNNHWHVKGTLLKDIPVTGVRCTTTTTMASATRSAPSTARDTSCCRILAPVTRWRLSMSTWCTACEAPPPR